MNNNLLSNLKSLYIIEKLEIPVLNGISTLPYTLDEFRMITEKTEELGIGILQIDLVGSSYNNLGTEVFEFSSFKNKDSTWYRNILVKIQNRNKLVEKEFIVHYVSPTFDIPKEILTAYYKADISDLNSESYQQKHHIQAEILLLDALRNHVNSAYNQLLNLYANDILAVSKKYVHYSFNPLHEAIMAFNSACKVYNQNEHGELNIYISYWIKSFLEQSVTESKKCT